MTSETGNPSHVTAAISGGIPRCVPSAAPWRNAVVSFLIAIAATGLTTVRFAPHFVNWRGLSLADDMPFMCVEYSRALAELQQIKNPFVAVADEHHGVIGWRLLFPLVWYVTALPAWLFLAVPHGGCVVTLWGVAWMTYERLQSWPRVFLVTALFAGQPWFFVSSGWLGYFDSWLVLGLVLASFARTRVTLAMSCLLTPWVDERFLIALPGCLLTRFMTRDSMVTRRASWQRDVAVATLATVPYLATRGAAWLSGDTGSATYAQSHWESIQRVVPLQFLIGLWSGYRAGWIYFPLAVIAAARRNGLLCGLALASLVMLEGVGGLFIAWDMSRTLMILTPIFLWGVWSCEDIRWPVLRWLLPLCLVANLILPARHVTWFMDPELSSLATEIGMYRDPPRAIVARESVYRARVASAAGDMATARREFDAAVTLDPDYAQAYVERAVVRVNQNDALGAEADLDTALRLNEDYPIALLMRGQLRQLRGDAAGAAQDVQDALRRAPPDWPMKENADRTLQELRLPSGRVN